MANLGKYFMSAKHMGTKDSTSCKPNISMPRLVLHVS